MTTTTAPAAERNRRIIQYHRGAGGEECTVEQGEKNERFRMMAVWGTHDARHNN